jgi:signal transduction histidine kinase
LSLEDLRDNPETEPGPFIAVSVSDTGSGMTPDITVRAFDPFFTTKAVGRGSGLGLSEVLGVVRQLRGHVVLKSAPGQGSVVTLFLPRAR